MPVWDNVEWAAYAQPWRKPPDTVPRLLARLAAVGRDGPVGDLRSPVRPRQRPRGNLLPAGRARGALPRQTLDLLTDLLGSSEPDPEAVPAASEREGLRAALREAGASLRPLVQAVGDGTLGGGDARQAARELLALL